MGTTNTYLNFNGNCEEAFNFYKSVLGGEFTHIERFGDTPESEENKMSEADKEKIMHISLPIGTSILMGSDTIGEWATLFTQGNNFSISVTTDSKEEADRIFNGLTSGGQITMPMDNTFWGDYFGMLTDKFEISWMIRFNEQQQN